MNDPMLKFVKAKLEENEGVAPAALARILASAKTANAQSFRPSFFIRSSSLLLAASLAIAACSWFVSNNAADARQEANLTNVIALLRVADGGESSEAASLADDLLAWQDALSL